MSFSEQPSKFLKAKKDDTVWFDVNTPKQSLLMDSIAKEMEARGLRSLFTTRQYEYTTSLLEKLGRSHVVLGQHGGGTLEGKLRTALDRMTRLLEHLTAQPSLPALSVHFASPDAARVAFGLGLPSFCLNDTPHSSATNRLCGSLASYYIIPSPLPIALYHSYGVPEDRLLTYKGVDEVQWLKTFVPDPEVPRSIGLTVDESFVIMRPEETEAGYLITALRRPSTTFVRVLKALEKNYDGKVVFFPRYSWQADIAKQLCSRIILPQDSVIGSSLAWYADLVVTGGGTMAREAALLGVPGISYFPLPLILEEGVKEWGFPVFHLSVQEAIEQMLKILKEPPAHRVDTTGILASLECPTDALLSRLEID